MVSSDACGAHSVGDACSAGGAASTGLVPLVMLFFAGLANEAASAVDDGSAGDACFCKF